MLPRRAAARLFLLAAVAVVVLIGTQTLHALRSQQRGALRVLHDHAATALWYFEQNLQSDLASTVECVFHDALHTTRASGTMQTLRIGVRHPVMPPAQLLLDRWFVDSQCAVAPIGRPASVFRFGPGAEIDVAGEPASAPYIDELRALVETAARERTPLRRSDGIAAGTIDSEPRLIFYSQQQVPGGSAIYAVPILPPTVNALITGALRDFRLLPPPVLPDTARAAVMRISIGVADTTLTSATLFRTAAAGAAVITATRALPAALGGLVATAEITPTGAAVLGQPPPHAARTTGLLALLLLSLGLVLLAYRQLRREQELTRLRGDFVASVSHELRTPLALQRIFLDTITHGRAPTPERMSWAIENIDRESRRLEHLVRNVLHFARGERGQLELEPRRVDLVAAVHRTVDAFRPLAGQRDMTIEVAGEQSVHVDLDEPAFHQALGNILENAVKYGPEQQRITVRVAAEAPWASVDVEDQGPGLPAGERVPVFEPFRRGREARGGAVAGSGIGLAVVRDVLTRHGGRVSLDDAPAGGLRVQLLLPLPAASSSGAT